MDSKIEPVAATDSFEIAATAAWDFIRPKLIPLNKEKGLAGVWSNGFRSGWDAKAREVEAARLRTVEADNARLRSEVERLTRERDEAQAGWKTASELLDAAVGDYNTEHVALTALTARTREVLAPFAEWFPEEALRRVPPDQRLMTTGLEARHFRAANTLFNELKEKDNAGN